MESRVPHAVEDAVRLAQSTQPLHVAGIDQPDAAFSRLRIHVYRVPHDDIEVDMLPKLGGESQVIVRDPRLLGWPRRHERDLARRKRRRRVTATVRS